MKNLPEKIEIEKELEKIDVAKTLNQLIDYLATQITETEIYNHITTKNDEGYNSTHTETEEISPTMQHDMKCPKLYGKECNCNPTPIFSHPPTPNEWEEEYEKGFVEGQKHAFGVDRKAVAEEARETERQRLREEIVRLKREGQYIRSELTKEDCITLGYELCKNDILSLLAPESNNK